MFRKMERKRNLMFRMRRLLTACVTLTLMLPAVASSGCLYASEVSEDHKELQVYAALLAEEAQLKEIFPGDHAPDSVLRFGTGDVNDDGLAELIVSLDEPDSTYNSDTCFYTLRKGKAVLIGIWEADENQWLGYHADTGYAYVYTDDTAGELKTELLSFPEKAYDTSTGKNNCKPFLTMTISPDKNKDAKYYLDGEEITEKEYNSTFKQYLGSPEPFYEDEYFYGWDGYELAAGTENTPQERIKAFGSDGFLTNETESETEVKEAETEAETQPVTETEAQPVTETEAQFITETEAQPVTETEAQFITETEAQPVTETQAQPVTETQAQPVTEKETQSVTETQSAALHHTPSGPGPLNHETEEIRETAPDWTLNILKEEHGALGEMGENGNTADPAGAPFGVEQWSRESIRGIYVLDTLAGMPADAVDISRDQDGRVMGWVDANQNLFIAGEGGVKAPSNCAALFAWYTNASVIDPGGNLHTEETTDMRFMFYHCVNAQYINLRGMDTSRAETFSKMFAYCSSLPAIDLSTLDTSSVKSFYQMFIQCNLLQTLDLSGFRTPNATKMSLMFYCCSSLREILFNPSLFDTSQVTSMESMFSGCKALSSIDVSWFRMQNCVNVTNMFNDCPNLPYLNLYGWNLISVSQEEHSGMFQNSSLESEYGPDGDELLSIAFAQAAELAAQEAAAQEAAAQETVTQTAPAEQAETTTVNEPAAAPKMELSQYIGGSFNTLVQNIPDMKLNQNDDDNEKWENEYISATGISHEQIVRIRVNETAVDYQVFGIIPHMNADTAAGLLISYGFSYRGISDEWVIYSNDASLYVAFQVIDPAEVGQIYVAQDGFLPIEY